MGIGLGFHLGGTGFVSRGARVSLYRMNRIQTSNGQQSPLEGSDVGGAFHPEDALRGQGLVYHL